MSFQLSNTKQTDLVPQSVLGYNNTSQYVSIDASSGIIFYDASSNISATIAWTGIGTTNPTGFDIISTINMNGNDINNINSLNSPIGGYDLTIGSSNQITMNSTDNTNINSSVSIRVTANESINLTAITEDMRLTSGQQMVLTANFGESGNPALDIHAPNAYIQQTTQAVSLTDGVNDTEILLDMGTASYQIPTITLSHNGQISSISNDDNLNIISDEQMVITSGKLMNIQSQNDAISLFSPNGKVFVDRSVPTSGDGEIVANTFTGTLNGNAATSNYSSSSGTSMTSTTAATASQIATTAIASSGSLFFLPMITSNTTTPSQTVYTDNSSSHLAYNITTGNLINPIFTGQLIGNANTSSSSSISAQANGVFTTIDTTTASNSPIFFGNSTSGNQSTKVNSNLYFTPTTNTLSCSTFSGSLSGSSTGINITSDNTSTTCYIPFSKTSGTGNKVLYQDDTTGPLSYTPSTGVLSSQYGQFGSGIINTSSVACNSSGGLTITGGSSGGLILNSGANTLQLQNNGSTIATVQSTGLAVSQINANGFNIYNGTFSPLSIASTTGISTFTSINTSGFTLPTTSGTATFASGTLSIVGSTSSTFSKYQISFSGTTNTVTTLALSSFPLNAEYVIAVYNGGSGNLTFNTGLGTGIRTYYAVPFSVGGGGTAIMRINYLAYPTVGNVYAVSLNNIVP
jgi:hypothetical protein